MDFNQLANQFLLDDIKFRIEQNYQKAPHPQIKGENVALLLVYGEKAPITAGTLAQRMNVSTARVACILNSLQNKKLIRRTTDKFDKRKIFISLTKLGRESIETQRAIVVKYFAEFFEMIGQEDAQKYIYLTNQFKEFIKSRRNCNDTSI